MVENENGLDCKRRGLIKPQSAFYKVNRAHNKRLFSSWCIKCTKEYSKKHNAKYRQYRLEYQRRARIEVVVALGGKCDVCGYSKYLQVLEIHVNPEIEKEGHRLWYLTKEGRQKLIRLHKQFKARFLCANCHTLNERGLI